MSNYSVKVTGHGTSVFVPVPGYYFPAMACSVCGILSGHFPSFRPEKKCAVCGDKASMLDIAEIDSDLCGSCYIDFCAWLEHNPNSLPMDFLRRLIPNGN